MTTVNTSRRPNRDILQLYTRLCAPLLSQLLTNEGAHLKPPTLIQCELEVANDPYHQCMMRSVTDGLTFFLKRRANGLI
ncbi:hypothetical protein EVAR_4240_1 [Eumeta japonica]|uniref:Uncharacterized protein n=1 Tax=Eumeta variegata TaxID=151549 RepID=A0A4C1TH93_EUMVA|nr:hypothetical protein EVAR_4240_1 [Eumeta japonica]